MRHDSYEQEALDTQGSRVLSVILTIFRSTDMPQDMRDYGRASFNTQISINPSPPIITEVTGH